jgi:hypothetical protein
MLIRYGLRQHVTDGPYAVSSFFSVAMARVSASAPADTAQPIICARDNDVV